MSDTLKVCYSLHFRSVQYVFVYGPKCLSISAHINYNYQYEFEVDSSKNSIQTKSTLDCNWLAD